jgi:hypothetical protein
MLSFYDGRRQLQQHSEFLTQKWNACALCMSAAIHVLVPVRMLVHERRRRQSARKHTSPRTSSCGTHEAISCGTHEAISSTQSYAFPALAPTASESAHLTLTESCDFTDKDCIT